MYVTSKGQVTIPRRVREDMGVRPAETEVEFLKDENGRWYLRKSKPSRDSVSRFRTAYRAGKLLMSTEEIMALTRNR
jgi:AbrB family looped-hinge helix DNA binding protein